MGKYPDLASQPLYFRTVFLLGAPGAPIEAFLQRSTGEFGEATPNWVRKGDVLNVKPFRRPFLGYLLGSSNRVTRSDYAPYFGAAHFKYGTPSMQRDEAKELSP